MPLTPNSIKANTFLVGGAVRDKLLGRPVKDKDYLVVGVTQQRMLELGFMPVGKDFPVFLHPKSKEEYALARTERKQGQGYTGFHCYAEPDVTIEQDLQRRDLTINAMALAADGTLIDPYHGQQDLQQRVLRHVSMAFVEDPLRVLRVARFAARYHALGFTVAPETLALMQAIADSGELDSLTPERVWQEMQRSLAEDNPEVFFQVLRACGALAKIWPDLDRLWGIPNPEQWHPEICSGIHTMMVLQQSVHLSDKISIRFAALCHDLGKGLTPTEQYPRHPGHETSGLALVEAICQRFRIPNEVKLLALKVCEFHLHCHKAFELKASTLLKLFNNLDIWRKPGLLQDFLLACQADFLGRKGFEQRDYPQLDFLQRAASAARQVQAKDVIAQGMQGPAIKQALHNARLQAIKKVQETNLLQDPKTGIAKPCS